MTKHRFLSISLLAATTMLGACTVHGTGGLVVEPAAVVVVVEAEPPPPRVEVIEVQPGFIWVTGRWQHSGGRWHWHGGHAERERVGYVYAPGQWQRRGRVHVWVDGRWNAGGGNQRREGKHGAVRDHRR